MSAPQLVVGSVVVVAAALLAVLLPLWTYGTTLAVFGLAHVAVELRYVEARFSERIVRPMLWGLVVLLGGIVALRLVRLLGVSTSDLLVPTELFFVGLLSGSVVLVWGRRAGLAGAASVAVAGLLAVGIALAPGTTILLLACLHNWTPVGFVAEATRGPDRARALALCAVVFGLIPGLILVGLPQAVLAPWMSTELTWFPTGPLERNLGAYLPVEWRGAEWATRAFSALVFAQCMHYAAVLGVLPRMAPKRDGGVLTRVPWRWYIGAIAVATAAFLVAYATDFKGARSVYGVAAAVHAWVEFPVLILALAPRGVAALAK